MKTDLRQRVEQQLKAYLPKATTYPQRLHEAMRYAVLNGGKRLRPLLTYYTGLACQAKLDQLDAAAVAVELIHCYSLVHDDLPAMDDDDLRRGRPTCHLAFDEATAILVGDALQTLAFQNLASTTQNAKMQLKMIETLSIASGSQGMVGGQAIDLQFEKQSPTAAELEQMHCRKTGALIKASILLGAYAAGCEDPTLIHHFDTFGFQLGLAFQIQDDILDVESDTATLGKTSGADVAQGKATYPAILGLEAAQRLQTQHFLAAKNALNDLPFDCSSLITLCDTISKRRS